jgi:hypothetical protein
MKIEISSKKGWKSQALCSEITGSNGGFFKTGTPAFCSESIVFLEKMKRRKKYLSKKTRQA